MIQPSQRSFVVPDIKVEADPAEVGLDAARLARIDAYLRRYVDDGRLPGWQLVVTRRNRVAHTAVYGDRHGEDGLPVQADSLFRIYSMTKPIISAAAMMLYEHGAFHLNDPVANFLPAFADLRVYTGGSDQAPVTVPATEPMRMVHLLTHTSGLTYGFFHQHPVDALYRANGMDLTISDAQSLEEVCDRIAGLPLLFQPGSRWAYSMATDVLGRVVEVISGQSLAAFLSEHIFEPLGMTDTAFGTGTLDASRLARLYLETPQGRVPADDLGRAVDEPRVLSGGGGLISSAHDYHRFTQMLLRGGELDGARLLGPRTLALMTRNHLPGGVDLETCGLPLYSEVPLRGVGFGLGFSVELDTAAAARPGNPGSYALGRRGQHALLGRSGRAAHRHVLHPAGAGPAAAAARDHPPAGVPGRDRRLLIPLRSLTSLP
jgi:CubicO group peptidase (beta-lactamase class C family)